MPAISNETYIDTVDAEEDGRSTESNEQFHSNWNILWVPDRISFAQGALDLRLQYVSELTDSTYFPRGSIGSGSRLRDSFDMQLDLDVSQMHMRHKLTRGDTHHAGVGGLHEAETGQNISSSISYRLPVGVSANLTDNTSLNYQGPQSVLDRGSEMHDTTATLEYGPPKVALDQHLKFETRKSTTRNPGKGAGTDGASELVEAQREIPLGNIGSLSWYYQHIEDSQSPSSLGDGIAGTTIREAQRVGLRGAVKDSPVSYSLDLQAATKQNPGGTFEDNSSSDLHLQLRPNAAGQRPMSLDVFSHLDQNRQHGSSDSETNSLHNWLVWSFRPHNRVEATFQFSQLRRTDDVRQQLEEDRDNVDAKMSYTLPGSKGGRLDFHLWQDTQATSDSSYIKEGMELQNQVVLGKAASVTFLYNTHTESNSTLGSSDPQVTQYVTTGVTYDVHPAPGFNLYGTWYHDLRLRDEHLFRFDGNHLLLNLNYLPDPISARWQYYLQLDSDAESTEDLSGRGYATRDSVKAGVSFRF